MFICLLADGDDYMKHCFTKNTWSCKFLATDGSVFAIFAQYRRARERKHSAGLLGKRDGRPASCWIIQNSSIQTHLCVECLLCVETAIFCSGRVTQSGPVWPLITPNYFTGVFLLLLSCAGAKFVCRWESPRTQRLCTRSRMSMPHKGPGPLTRNCANGENIALQANRWNLRSKSLVLSCRDPLASGRSPHSHQLLCFSVRSEYLTSSTHWCHTELNQRCATPVYYSAGFCLVLTESSVNGLVASIEVKSNSIFTLCPDKEPC